MSTYDLLLAPLGVILCLCAFVFLFVKYPSGLTFLGMTANGIAATRIFGITYVMIAFALQVIAVLRLFYLASSTHGTKRFWDFLTSRYSAFLWFSILIWLKIGVECAFTGFDVFRSDAIKVAANTVFLPSLIFLFSLVSMPPSRFIRGLFLGMILFSMAYVIPTLPGMIIEGRFLAAIIGIERLTTYNVDTIGGARFFFLGSIGAIGLLGSGLSDRKLHVVSFVVLCFLSVLLMLNGTRQYFAGVSVAVLGMMWIGVKSRMWKVIITLGVFGLASYGLFDILEPYEVARRISREEMGRELRESRGVIWMDVLKTGIENPITGTGFRRYGNIDMVQGQEAGSMAVVLSGAHGFFQDVWAEHGMLLAIVGLVCLISVYVQVFKVFHPQIHRPLFVFYIMMIAMMTPLLFSGAVFTGMPMYLSALALYFGFSKRRLDIMESYMRDKDLRLQEAGNRKAMQKGT
jgi:hypothetical protein